MRSKGQVLGLGLCCLLVCTSVAYGDTLSSYTVFNKQALPLYTKGQWNYNKRRYAQAIHYFRKFTKHKTPIQDYGIFYLGASYYKRKDYHRAAEYFHIIRKSHADSQFYNKALDFEAKSYIQSGTWDALKRLLQTIYVNPQHRILASYYYGRYFEHYKNYTKALEHYSKALRARSRKRKESIHKSIDKICTHLKKQGRYRTTLKKVHLTELGYSYYQRKDYTRALSILAFQNKENLTEALRFKRLHYILLACLKLKHFDYAKDLLKKMLQRFSKESQRITLLYAYYTELWNIKPQEALEGYQSIAHYKHPVSVKVNRKLVRHYQAIKQEYAQTRHLEYLGQANQSETLWTFFFEAFNQKRFGYLFRAFPKIINHLQDKKMHAKCYYWLGVVALELKQYKSARQFFIQSYLSYKHNYYSYKSLLYIKHYIQRKLIQGNIQDLRTQDKQLTQELLESQDFKKRLEGSFASLSQGKDQTILDKIMYLHQGGLYGAAKIELKRFLDDSQHVKYLRALSHYFQNQGDYQHSIYCASRLVKYLNGERGRNYIPEDLNQLYYPKHYQSIVEKYASRYKLNPHLVFAVIREESRFNQKARSHAGARGLMQIMPRTGKYLAHKIQKVPYDLYDIQTNIAMGSYYLSELMRQFKSYSYALASYNGGPTKMRRQLKQIETNRQDIINGEHIIENIQNDETRGYVKKVFTSFYSYMELYEGLTYS